MDYDRKDAGRIERALRSPAEEARVLIKKLAKLPSHATELRKQYLARLSHLSTLM
jgi:hypothetical protein